MRDSPDFEDISAAPSGIGRQRSKTRAVQLRSEITIDDRIIKEINVSLGNLTPNQVQYQDAQLRNSPEAFESASVGQLAEKSAGQPDQDYPLDPVQHDRVPGGSIS